MKGIKYLESLNNRGIRLGLDRIKLLLDYLGNPQDKLNIIHVAGTNGKGSTSAILTAIYKEAGYKVGTYTSPHITEFNERIRINNINISNQDLEELIEEMKPVINRVARELELPTYFEVITALAFLYYYRQEVDLLVLEVGLGGRYDATNAMKSSLVSIITNVSLDHTDRLGNDLEKIAWEKAGVIKEGQVVITATEDDIVEKQIAKVANEQNAELININNKFKWIEHRSDLSCQVFDLKSSKRVYTKLQLPLLGRHQVLNTATAIGAIEAIEDRYPLTIEEIKSGISKVRWPGRVEVLFSNPTIILDGAHNIAGAKTLLNVLDKLDYQNLFLVLSILGDKDVEGIVSSIVPKATKVILTQNSSNRVIDIESLKDKVERYNSNIETQLKLEKAVESAVAEAKQDDLILISGSLYTVAEARSFLLKEKE
ncbi:folylpolyglutamate synthase/dihydrofolate synthase [Orenia metallireducens]|jgi:dihydrofolate synthase/folylpolyglutamate synthase|uniref:Dihydrofolate synthase/folylpolyglutamate synthase n=1 Tax=Orenia metallireducens TaxID=1413210 RepID=A0A1C0A564_9FIRM|nr:folylpolyglutamate synthase/dihydrofolate synthase family protein [Orenia metallireducens]OCL25287.1 folylpolyglutamate synthase/dihydrofolate synthase [Orenia metallireducens]